MTTPARCNPFRTECIEALRYRPEGWPWNDLLARLERLRWRGAIVGAMGAGKTTLLEDLSPRLCSRGFTPHFVRLDENSPQLSRGQVTQLNKTIGPGSLILLDGCEQMTYLAWRRFQHATRRAAGLIVTTHRPGRLPTLVTCRPSVDVLHHMLVQLLSQQVAANIDVAALHRRHHGNIRQALRELYDRASDGEFVEPAARATPAPCPAHTWR